MYSKGGYGSPFRLAGYERPSEGYGSPLLKANVIEQYLEAETYGGEVVVKGIEPWPDGMIQVEVLPVGITCPKVSRDTAFPELLHVHLPRLAPGRYSLRIRTLKGTVELPACLFVLPEGGHPLVRMLRGYFPPSVYRIQS